MSGNRTKARVPVSTPGTGKPDTIIGALTRCVGTLRSAGNIRIDGTAEGEIDSAGDLLISASAHVIATIKAQNIHVFGAVKGVITASARLEVAAIGKIWGDITTTALHIEPGALFRGQCTMRSASDEPLLLNPPQSGDTE